MNEKLEKKLRKLLHESETPVEIMFLKKDGSQRKMKATTNAMLIPKEFQVKRLNEDGTPLEKKERKVSDLVIPVFDIEAGGWRSFTKENLRTINSITVEEFESK